MAAGEIIDGTCRDLAAISTQRREELDRLAADAAARLRHAELLAQLPFARHLEAREPASPRVLGREARVVAWNLQRCVDVEASAALIARSRAGLALLTELDCGMARSGQRHTARDLADALGCGYAFAVEFLELGLGDAAERARCAGERNEVGYHGGAVLAVAPFARPVCVRVEPGGDWFGGDRGESRIGARMAVVATVSLAGRDVVLASLHLESHSTPAQRAAQVGVLLDAVDRYAPGAPALIGGDLNAFSLGPALWEDRERLREALREDPDRLVHPVPHEPLFAAAADHGFEWQACNVRGVATHRVVKPEGSQRGGLKIDWFLSRGLVTTQPEVLVAVDPDSGKALSDHEPIAVTIAVA